MSLRDVKEATANDPFMSELYKLIELGEWSDKIQFKAFQLLRQELSIYEGIILRGNHIVMPKQLVTNSKNSPRESYGNCPHKTNVKVEIFLVWYG